MTKRVRPRLKRVIPRNFIAEWREHRGYTQDAMLDRLQTMFDVEMSAASLSRYERSLQPLATDLLALFAEVLSTTSEALISRPPTAEAGLLEIWSQIPEADRDQAMRVLETFRKKANG